MSIPPKLTIGHGPHLPFYVKPQLSQKKRKEEEQRKGEKGRRRVRKSGRKDCIEKHCRI